MAGIGRFFARSSSLGEAEQEQRRTRLEIMNAVLLGIAAVATAYAGYRSALLGGDAVKDYTKAVRAVNESSQAYTEGNQAYALDQAVFLEYVKAVNDDKADLAAYLRGTLMSDQLLKGIAWWEKQEDGPDTPFVDENPDYEIPQWQAGEELLTQTDELFASGERNDDRGDNFDLVVAIFATTLFLYGIAGVARKYSVQFGSLLGGSVIFVLGIVKMATI